MRRVLIILTLLFLSPSIIAATYTTITTGAWGNTGTWDASGVPATSMTAGSSININHAITSGTVTVGTSGTSTIYVNANTTLTSITFESSGTLNVVVANGVTFSVGSLTTQNGVTVNVTGNITSTGNVVVNQNSFTVSKKLTVGGTLQLFNNATLNLNKADIAANLELNNGIINISGIVNVDGNADLNNSGSFVNISDYGALLVTGLLDMDNVDVLGTGVVGWGSITMTNNANFQGLGDRVVPTDNPFDLDGIPAVLPITLINFTVKDIDQNVTLNWATSSELNFDYFSLQRSSDGYDYKEIAQIQGHGNSKITRYYDYIDKTPLSGTSYYRLKSIDFDGYTEIFRPISVFMEKSSTFSAYPNPVINNELTLELKQEYANSIYRLFDLNGKIIIQYEAQRRIETIDFSNLLPGVYFLSVNGGAPIKILKQ